MFSRTSLSTILLCALLPLSLASYDPPPPLPPNPTPYSSNFTRVNGLAPLFNMDHEARIEDSYIVIFGHSTSSSSSPDSVDSDDDCSQVDNHWAHLGQNLSHMDDFVKLGCGYGATITDAALLARIRADANVLFVETDKELTLF